MPYLLRLLPKRPYNSPYVVYLDNLFTSTKLLKLLRKEGFGATGTARTNSGIYDGFIKKKQFDKAKDIEPWGKLYSAPTTSDDIIQYAWKDNALVLFLSTINDATTESMVIRNRKRPGSTSTSAKTARKPFGSQPRKDLPIPKFVDNYNHYMNQVDVADHLRSTNPGNRRIRKGGWHALWNFIFHVTFFRTTNQLTNSGWIYKTGFYNGELGYSKNERITKLLQTLESEIMSFNLVAHSGIVLFVIGFLDTR